MVIIETVFDTKDVGNEAALRIATKVQDFGVGREQLILFFAHADIVQWQPCLRA